VVVVRDETPSPHGLVGVGVGDLDTYGDLLTFAWAAARGPGRRPAMNMKRIVAATDGFIRSGR
jgi:hypothetical protein